MITVVQTKEKNRGLKFKDSALAHRFCQGVGIEIGAAAHNPFNLPGCLNLAPASDGNDFDFYRKHQVEMSGGYAKADIDGEADATGLPDDSQDYVISSHVVEHLPNVLGAFREWQRILKPGGIVFMIIPKANAHHGDVGRAVASAQDLIFADHRGYTIETHPYQEQGRRGHYWVLDVKGVCEAVKIAFPRWRLLEIQETDDKVGNGFTLVFAVEKEAQSVPEAPAESPVEAEAGLSGSIEPGEVPITFSVTQVDPIEVPSGPTPVAIDESTPAPSSRRGKKNKADEAEEEVS